MSASDSLAGLLSGDQFAFPGSFFFFPILLFKATTTVTLADALGGDCSNGRECLLDSVCRNDVCGCKEGLYTLRIGDTYNCVPDNPADAGKSSILHLQE